MTQQYDNTNTATLFRNERKATDRHPDHNGTATVKCPHCGEVSEFWLAAWVKTAGQNAKRAGQKFFSMAFTSKDEQRQQQGARNFNDFDNDDNPAF